MPHSTGLPKFFCTHAVSCLQVQDVFGLLLHVFLQLRESNLQ